MEWNMSKNRSFESRYLSIVWPI